MSDLTLIVIGIVAFIFLIPFCIRIIKKIMFVKDDKNFKEDSEWPQWFIDDAKEYAKNHPDKYIKMQPLKK